MPTPEGLITTRFALQTIERRDPLMICLFDNSVRLWCSPISDATNEYFTLRTGKGLTISTPPLASLKELR